MKILHLAPTMRRLMEHKRDFMHRFNAIIDRVAGDDVILKGDSVHMFRLKSADIRGHHFTQVWIDEASEVPKEVMLNLVGDVKRVQI